MAQWTKYMLVPLLLWIVANWAGGKVEGRKMRFHSFKDVPASSWEKLRQSRIFFGHQSVGNNIIKGMKALGRDNPQVRLKIVRFAEDEKIDGPGFYHSSVGKNDDPISKIDAFVDDMNHGIGNSADFAFFKFCFVDITARTDVQKLFANYSKKMDQLQKIYPRTTFIHFTVPLLRKNKDTIVNTVKKLFRKDDGFFSNSHNISRNRFNELLRERYQERQLIFDLARIESTFPDGKRCAFTKDGEIYYSLVPQYTKDGGHLNEAGQKVVAEQILVFLAGLCD